MNTQKINEHLAILHKAFDALHWLKHYDTYKKQYAEHAINQEYAEKEIKKYLELYAECIAGLTPKKFLESNYNDTISFGEWTAKSDYVFEHGMWRFWDDTKYISTEKLHEVWESQRNVKDITETPAGQNAINILKEVQSQNFLS